MESKISRLIGVVFVLFAKQSLADEAADHTFFEARVRPLLVAKCLECHGSDKPKAGLRLDSRESLLKGGESGPAVVVVPSDGPADPSQTNPQTVGKPEESLLIDVISYRNTVQMPPKAKLSPAEIATLTEWVRRGVPWPNSKGSVPQPATTVQPGFSDEQTSFWAFQPVGHPIPPNVRSMEWTRSPIDRFILTELESKGLTVSREAEKRTLIRRVTIDLTGLVPTPDDVAEFVSDVSDDAYERLVDRLLASPRYGERWARHWLDVARYADSNGLDENLAFANAFRYRDYVVKAMREDKPYDRFLIEQIAGDLLETDDASSNGGGGTSLEEDSFDPIVATGFLCLGAKMLAEDDPVKMQMDIIDEQVDTIARAVMGMTMGCARCHDHKYDPLTQEDYYGLAGIFKSTQTMDTFTVVARWHERPLATRQQLQTRDELQQLATAQTQAVEKIKADATEAILTEARQIPGAYLLAATREWRLAEQLSNAQPRGNLPNLVDIPNAILIEAEDFVRGNVLKDRDTYGKGIGVLVNRGETPNFVEYDVDVAKGGTFQFELRYAAAASRPVRVMFNERLIKSDAAGKVTGSWTPESQTWFVESLVTLKTGRNLIRLEQPQFFPHIDKLLLTPVEGTGVVAESESSLATVDGASKPPRLIPSITRQWVKALEATKGDSKSVLAAWHHYVRTGQLTAEDLKLETGHTRLMGADAPTSLEDLARRYDQFFASAQSAWLAMKASEQGKGAQALPDTDLEGARMLLADPKGPFGVPADIESELGAEVKVQLTAGREELARREASVPKFAETMAVTDAKSENLKIHLRGSHLTLGREVPRRFPQIFTAVGNRDGLERKESLLTAEGSGRLPLARWLTRPEHPLTARVMANRIWQWHFGQGLVRSPDNFGRLGERPSHPALLDWLASEFSGQVGTTAGTNPRVWSLKALHRSILTTATYRQNTEFHPAAALVDPENRLLWRSHRQRMDIEVLRDSLLAIGGQLDEAPAGSLLPTANRNYVTSTANVNPAVYSSVRRSIYLPVVRSALYEVFTAFDFADPSTLAGQRDQTTVAPQALFMMNSSLVLEQVRSLAGQLLKTSERDDSARIRDVYNRAYSRDPYESEVSRCCGYLSRIRDALSTSGVEGADIEVRAWTSLCRAILSANEFVYVD